MCVIFVKFPESVTELKFKPGRILKLLQIPSPKPVPMNLGATFFLFKSHEQDNKNQTL